MILILVLIQDQLNRINFYVVGVVDICGAARSDEEIKEPDSRQN